MEIELCKFCEAETGLGAEGLCSICEHLGPALEPKRYHPQVVDVCRCVVKVADVILSEIRGRMPLVSEIPPTPSLTGRGSKSGVQPPQPGPTKSLAEGIIAACDEITSWPDARKSRDVMIMAELFRMVAKEHQSPGYIDRLYKKTDP